MKKNRKWMIFAGIGAAAGAVAAAVFAKKVKEQVRELDVQAPENNDQPDACGLSVSECEACPERRICPESMAKPSQEEPSAAAPEACAEPIAEEERPCPCVHDAPEEDDSASAGEKTAE